MNWIEADWPAPAHVRAGTTLRQGGVSHPPYHSFNLAQHVGDDPADVEQNRLQLPHADTIHWLQQTHSTQVLALPTAATTVQADAVYTTVPNQVCAVMTADCLPLLLSDRQGSVVAAVHAGWRGLQAGIIEKTLQQMPTTSAETLVWLGPAIGPQVYEVGKEVYDAFTRHDDEAAGYLQQRDATHWLLDMYGMARLRLAREGVTQVYGGTHCTYTEADRFYSYRRDGMTGRMASLIWIEQ